MKTLFKWVFGFLIVVALLTATFLSPVDLSDLGVHPFYLKMLSKLDTLHPVEYKPSRQIQSSWTRISILPDHNMPMAGYAPRSHFDTVHDSLFAHLLMISNDRVNVIFISIDLMLFPPSIKEKIEKALAEDHDNNFLYLSCSHTHSSLGGWDNTLVGNLVLGSYDEKWVDQVSANIVLAIRSLRTRMKPTRINYWESDAHEYVENRLDPEHGVVDGMLRGLRLFRSDSSKGILITYSGHPTNIDHRNTALSGDFPGRLNDEMLKRGMNFSIFLSGMVGSHRLKGFTKKEFEMLDEVGSKLADKIQTARQDHPLDSFLIKTSHIEIEHGPSQLHVLKGWSVRNWAFNAFLNPLKGELTYLEMGNIIMIGTPCDFSGAIYQRERLDSLASTLRKKMIVTSFNGNYTGYIIEDQFYESSEQEEARAMNWVGPHFGNYYGEMIKKLIPK